MPVMNTRKPRVGLLALTLELYEELSPTLRESRERWLVDRVLPALAPLADVEFDRAVFRREEIDAVVAGYEAGGVDGLLVICLTYSPSQLSLPALGRTRLPILVWNTQELFAVGGDFDGAAMVANHGVHGTQDLANVLVRAGVPFEYVTSHLNDSNGLVALGDWFAAASAVARLRRARLGLMGYPFPGMGDFAVDTTHLAATLGCQWLPLPIEAYLRGAEDAHVDDVETLIAEYRRHYDVADDLTDRDLDLTARAELSLRRLVADERLDAMSFQFMAIGEDERTQTVPFVAVSRLMAEGMGFAGEGDLVGAAGTWLLGQLRPPATFSEMFTIDFEGNGLLMSHMGEANVAMARTDRRVPLVARPKPITRTRGRQLALVTSLEPGPATLFALTLGPNGRWRLISSRVRIVDGEVYAGLAAPHFKIAPECGVREWLTAYANSGGPHHNAICFGDATRRIRAAAGMLDAEHVTL